MKMKNAGNMQIVVILCILFCKQLVGQPASEAISIVKKSYDKYLNTEIKNNTVIESNMRIVSIDRYGNKHESKLFHQAGKDFINSVTNEFEYHADMNTIVSIYHKSKTIVISDSDTSAANSIKSKYINFNAQLFNNIENGTIAQSNKKDIYKITLKLKKDAIKEFMAKELTFEIGKDDFALYSMHTEFSDDYNLKSTSYFIEKFNFINNKNFQKPLEYIYTNGKIKDKFINYKISDFRKL
ncbi:MAG: hypothetical protein HY738_17670 [Bacteroidia bacterium]|nr:hypothetical protein [Bacteroidia bacterium]